MNPSSMIVASQGLAVGPPVTISGHSLLVAIVVVALLAVAAWMLRRHSPVRRGRQSMAIESGLPLGERRSLLIVSVEGRRLLLGLAPSQVTLITELRAEAPSEFAKALDAAHATGGGA